MEKLLHFFRGYVRIRLRGGMPERFLKLCAYHGIILRRVTYRDGCYEMELSLRDFFRLKPACRKSGSRIHILRKSGMPFFFYRNKKRKAFFVGIFCCLLLLYLCSTRIWNIHVEGNYGYSIQNIISYLESERITHGTAKKKINCSVVSALLREHFPDITWVSAKIVGTRLLITVRENMDAQTEENQTTEPYDLTAGCSGKIVGMITRRGVPQMAVGQTCKKGDVLISGRLEILNDSGEVIRYEYVPADGDVYVQRDYVYRDEFPRIYQKRVYSGRTRRSFCMQVHCYRLQIGLPRRGFRRFDQVCDLHSFRLTENFVLPIEAGLVMEREYVIRDQTYSPDECREIAGRHIMKFLEELSEKVVKISENNVKISIGEKSCVSSGTVTVIEKTGEAAPVEKLQDPEERNPADEQ